MIKDSGNRREFSTGAVRDIQNEQEDENHFIAFIWNIICCIWTNTHLPEMRDLPYERTDV